MKIIGRRRSANAIADEYPVYHEQLNGKLSVQKYAR
jgi:hypothetical protein